MPIMRSDTNRAEPSGATETPFSHQAMRRQLLGTLGAAGLATLFGCGGGEEDSSSDNGTSSSSGGTSGTTDSSGMSCSVVPSETAGPYPADGSYASNRTYNVLTLDGIVRQDIRSNIDGSGTASGAQLTLNIRLTNVNADCDSLEGYAIYIWHCTSGGDYSVYTEASVSSNYLRGVQATASDGVATFITVMPGCYTGRVPHIHVEIYPSLAQAKSATSQVKTTQLAFPSAVMQALYGTSSEYSESISSFNGITFATDNVFSDGYADQIVTIAGDSANGYVADIEISIAA